MSTFWHVCTLRKALPCALATAYLVMLTLPTTAACDTPLARAWATAATSEDGSTIVKRTSSSDHMDRGLIDLGFFSATGQLRTIIAQRHARWRDALSRDGYCAIWGKLRGEDAYFLTLYNPYGTRLWEVRTDQQAALADLQVATGGKLVAAAVNDIEGPAYAGFIVLYEAAGKELLRKRLDSQDYCSWLRFLPGEKHLIAASAGSDGTDIRYFSLGSGLTEMWHAHLSGVTSVHGHSANPTLSRVAVAGWMRISAGGKRKYAWAVAVFSVADGKVLNVKTMPESFWPKKTDPRYDPEKKHFVLEGKDGSLTEIDAME